MIENKLPDDIINLIFDYTGINCHVCQKQFRFNFYKKLNKKYYCSLECFDFI